MLPTLIRLSGFITLVLGVTHFYYPALFGYRLIFDAYPKPDRKLEPFRMGPLRYPMTVDKAYGIIWMMNIHVSMVLTSIGILESGWPLRLLYGGASLPLWIAAWWAVRAACQPLLLGKEWYDWLISAGFASLCLGHLWIGMVAY